VWNVVPSSEADVVDAKLTNLDVGHDIEEPYITTAGLRGGRNVSGGPTEIECGSEIGRGTFRE